MTKYLLLAIFLFAMAIWLPSLVVYQIQERPAVTTQFPNRVQEVLPSVVHIMCDNWQGSGVAISRDIVVTARHVIDGLNYTIPLNDGMVVKGTQAITHKDYDIGFIKVDRAILKPAKFGSIKACVLGQSVFIIGSPYGKINFNNITLGIISGLDRDWDKLSYSGESYGWKVAFTSDAGAHPGNSGGPIFTMDGVVRGLLVGGYSPVLNCGMPSDLFFGDIKNIKLMFAFEKYKVEKGKSCSYLQMGVTKSGRCGKCHGQDSKVTIRVDMVKRDSDRIYYSVSGSSDNYDEQGWAVYLKKKLIIKGSGEGEFDLPIDGKTYRVYWVDKKSAFVEIKVE